MSFERHERPSQADTELGVGLARRAAWLTKEQILNTRSCSQIQRLL
jgi:hypothetical protein